MGATGTELCGMLATCLKKRDSSYQPVVIAFPFPELEEGTLVVDVGGGIGSTTLRLAERFPRLRFIVQDREPVCRLGEDVQSFLCNASRGVNWYHVGMAYSQPSLDRIR